MNVTANISIHIHGLSDEEAETQAEALTTILDLIRGINGKIHHMAHTLNDVLDDLAAEKSVIGGLSALVSGLRQQVKDALDQAAAAGTTIPQATQDQIDAVFDAAESNKAGLAAALVDNTPASTVDPTSIDPATPQPVDPAAGGTTGNASGGTSSDSSGKVL